MSGSLYRNVFLLDSVISTLITAINLFLIPYKTMLSKHKFNQSKLIFAN